MLDNKKIRLMSRLAVYDKKYGGTDRKKNAYFKWDYIYFRNFWTRAGVFFGCMIITLFYILKKLLVDQTDLTTIDYKFEATKIGFSIIITLVVYTIIGTVVAKSEYKKSRRRMEAYFSMLDKLDALNRGANEEAAAEDNRYDYKDGGKNFAEPEYEYEQETEYENENENGGGYGYIPGREYERDNYSVTSGDKPDYKQHGHRGRKPGFERIDTGIGEPAPGERSIDILRRLKEVRRRDGNNNGESGLLPSDSDNGF